MPSSGAVEITFHGAAYCSSSTIADSVVDLTSQIVTSTTAAVNVNGPGGLRHAVTLKDESDHALNSSTTFNLASTRVIRYPSGGSKSVFFKFERLRMDTGTRCYIYNATFSAVFVP